MVAHLCVTVPRLGERGNGLAWYHEDVNGSRGGNVTKCNSLKRASNECSSLLMRCTYLLHNYRFYKRMYKMYIIQKVKCPNGKQLAWT